MSDKNIIFQEKSQFIHFRIHLNLKIKNDKRINLKTRHRQLLDRFDPSKENLNFENSSFYKKKDPEWKYSRSEDVAKLQGSSCKGRTKRSRARVTVCCRFVQRFSTISTKMHARYYVAKVIAFAGNSDTAR